MYTLAHFVEFLMNRTPLFSELIYLLVFVLWAFEVFDLYRDLDLKNLQFFLRPVPVRVKTCFG